MMQRFGAALVRFSCDHPRLVVWVMALSTLALLAVATLPTVRPDIFRSFNPLVIDTDPENMLSADEPVRVFHTAMKKEFSLHDVIVVGIVNETHPDSVFNTDSLRRIHELATFATGLRWPDPEHPGRTIGVVDIDMLAPSTVDNIEQAGPGTVSFSWLMAEPPARRDEALAVRERVKKLPMLDNTLVSGDGKAIALYLPVTSKDVSNRIRDALLEKTKGWKASGDQVHITGLPVAEDTFGVEMFVQMAISAPLAMLMIFGVLWLFFRHLRLIAAPMIIAMVAPMATMALLVMSGKTVHIMSSMIPVFLMPIAVLDAVHILSEFFDRYQRTRDRRRTVVEAMEHLFAPMLYTSLTTMVGFASLALTPIPPFQVFGVFVAIGVGLAWLWTVTFIPAYIILLPEHKLSGFGQVNADPAITDSTLTGRLLARLGPAMAARAPATLAVMALVAVAAGYGISRIVINDNPVNWFEEDHAIRVADRVLNRHFGGTYMAHLALESEDAGAAEAFKQPEVLGYVERLQQALEKDGDVGKSTSLADIVKTVHRELMLGEPQQFRVPGSAAAVAQILLTFESSHRPHDLWHFVTPDFRKANIWVQLKSGDNQDMARVVRSVERFMAANPPPMALNARWFGLNYVNLEWQDKMVSGMVNSLLGSFATVLVMMTILFRSLKWGLLCMVPLSVTIGLSYGIVGLIGKDFDMPIAVLSSLSLGLAVDYAIHFLSRARTAQAQTGSWRAAVAQVYAEPARAIVRNAVVLAVGFTPLLAAPLVTYQTVGIFMAAVALASGLATILLLPALLAVFEHRLFRPRKAASACLLAVLFLSIGPATAAQTAPTVDEIVHRTNLAAYFQGRDGRARVHLEIKDAQGRVREREVTILRRDDPATDELKGNAYRGEQKYYVYFHEPADVARMALLVWKHQAADDDRWLFLPALDLVRRIAASDKRTSFAGSDFFYEDVSGRSIDADEHELIGTTEHYYILRNRPKDPAAVEFSYYDMHIHKGTFLPVQAEYFDRNGTKYRAYKTLAVEAIQGRPTVTRASMSDLRKGSTTTVSYRDVAYDVGLPGDIFTERFLRRAPTEHLR